MKDQHKVPHNCEVKKKNLYHLLSCLVSCLPGYLGHEGSNFKRKSQTALSLSLVPPPPGDP